MDSQDIGTQIEQSRNEIEDCRRRMAHNDLEISEVSDVPDHAFLPVILPGFERLEGKLPIRSYATGNQDTFGDI